MFRRLLRHLQGEFYISQFYILQLEFYNFSHICDYILLPLSYNYFKNNSFEHTRNFSLTMAQ
jgi:hypothetical protein